MSDVNVGVGGLKEKRKKKVEQKGSINMVAKERPLLLHPQGQSSPSILQLGEKRTFDLTFHIEHGGRTDELKYIEKRKLLLSFFSLLTIATLSPTLL